jgi:hypothetical protein
MFLINFILIAVYMLGMGATHLYFQCINVDVSFSWQRKVVLALWPLIVIWALLTNLLKNIK